MSFFFFNDTATTEIYTLSLHDALPIWPDIVKAKELAEVLLRAGVEVKVARAPFRSSRAHSYTDPNAPVMTREFQSSSIRSEEHTSELQSRQYLVCRLLLEKKKIYNIYL